MPSKPKGRIKTVDDLHRRYTRSNAAQFTRSAEDLLRTAEEKGRGELEAGRESGPEACEP